MRVPWTARRSNQFILVEINPEYSLELLNDINLSNFQEIMKDREAWHTAVHGVTKNRTQLSDFTFTLDCKEIQPVHPKGDQFWVYIGRTDAEAETPIL